MLEAHYTLKCTSCLISPDLLKACVTSPTTSVCEEGRVGTNSLVHVWRKLSPGAWGPETVLCCLLMGAARTFQLLLTPSDRKTLNNLSCRSFRTMVLRQNSTPFLFSLKTKIENLQTFQNQEWLKSQKRPRKWFLQFENESLSSFLHTRWRQIGLGRRCRELSAFESEAEGKQQPLKTSQKSLKLNKNGHRSAIFFFSPPGRWSDLFLSPNMTICVNIAQY